MIARIFVQRPVLAGVFAIALMLLGGIALRFLPVSQYPNISPPMVLVEAVYPGASAKVVENSVTQILEQSLKGLDGLLYFDSVSTSDGVVELTLVFDLNTDVEVAQVRVQNKVNQISYRLPAQVQQRGITVNSLQNSFLMVAVFHDASGRLSDSDIANWISSSMEDPLSRLPGVGAIRNFGAPYAMRIWLDPHQLAAHQLMPSDVEEAIYAQNTEVPVGELGARPHREGQQLNVTVTAMSRLQSVDDFASIVLKTRAQGDVVRLGDVARIEIGRESYASTSRLNGKPASGLAMMMAPGANAMATASAVKNRIAQLRHTFPAGVDVFYPEDASRFVKRSIRDVLRTLAEALVLVVLVMYLFLQNWRVTLIPTLTIPIVLLGTCCVIALLGYSLNTLNLFAMVLAIGLLVDDAIVVVEHVERTMMQEKLDARSATLKSMQHMTRVLIGIALVLAAVFLPMAAFPGSVGVIYRQFSVTLVTAMALSAVVALTLTPALCAALLKPADGHKRNPVTRAFNRLFSVMKLRYHHRVTALLKRPLRFSAIYLVLLGSTWWAYQSLPTAFIPEDDQGTVMVRYALPEGASYTRTRELVRTVENYFMQHEAKNIAGIYTVSGFSFSGSGQNAGIGFVPLKDWSQRQGQENSAQAIAARANRALADLVEGKVFAMVLPPIDGLGDTNGFEFWLQDVAGRGREALVADAWQLVNSLTNEPDIMFADADGGESSPNLNIHIDQQKASAMGLNLHTINQTLSTAWGGRYVNDFVYDGQLRKVFIQADAPFRSAPENINDWQVRNNLGEMVPFSAFTAQQWESGPGQISRFNGLPAVRITGAAAPGASSGRIMERIETLAATLPGTNYEWSGLSYQDKISSGSATLLYTVSILFVFLCLAALYESWSIPLAILLVIPLGVLGAVVLVMLSGQSNDIFFQIGVLTSIGLSARNGILIVEFAEHAIQRGGSAFHATRKAASLRLRPILMTSLSFGAGVVPLIVATGPAANAQHAIGLAVLGGVITATLLTIFYVPLAYLAICRIRGWLSSSTQPINPVASEGVPL
ncbi:RND transporter, HAE1 family [Teredinibacter turnerae T7901]|uniref:Efflux pump membrane transporter n=1 Tax=Teredinibacter turnerae (strain ATCC 39867 / T7901) TaxID=377629 RepID=C5BUC1_TERTT|nr:multidrug efflux RND transporter permease subunit [Teredinibacter turnerae]ACR11213.1 RND transporter, HAE1 family [Teredinibacter turnerae T7901]